MPFLNLTNARLYYEEEGQGTETMVFGHSLLFNLRMFDDQVAFFKDRYRCLRLDFRGQGQSEITAGGYDFETLTEDVREFIEVTNAAPCHFVGFSMGGMVAMRLAIKYPELIKSLILIDTSSEPEPTMSNVRNKAMVWVGKNFGLKILAGRVLKMFMGKAALKRSELRQTWKDHFIANDRAGIIKAIGGVMQRKGITHLLPQIDHQTLILVGEDDILTDPEKAEVMHRQIQHSHLIRIPRAGHLSTVEEPAFVNEAMQDFLKQLDP